VNDSFDMIEEKLSLRVEVGAREEACIRRCAELANARVEEILLLRRSECCDLGLHADETFKLAVECAIRSDILVCRDLVCGIPVDKAPALVVEGPDLLRKTRELSGHAPVAGSHAARDAGAKPRGIEHDLSNHLEDLSFEYVGAHVRIAAALDARPVVHVLLGCAIAAVHCPVIDGHLS
jgi:hypothetical protein